MQAPFTRFPQPVVCSICNKQYKDVHEHIEHMTTVHQMKATFRCSTCGDMFPTKVAVEAHLATHAASGNGPPTALSALPATAINLSASLNNNGISNNINNNANNNGNNYTSNFIHSNNIKNAERSSSTPSKEGDKPSSSGSSILSNIQVTRSACDAENVLALDIEEDEEDEDDDLLKEVYNCACGKAYLLRMSFDAHQKVCPTKKQQFTPSGRKLELSDINLTRKKESPQKRTPTKGRLSGSLDALGLELSGSGSSYCPKMVENIHSDGDTNCKACLKPMKGFISLCNHLSRRSECRSFYNDNLIPGQSLKEDKSNQPKEPTTTDKNKQSKDSQDKGNNSFAKSSDSLNQSKRASSNASTPNSSAGGSSSNFGNNSNTPADSKGQTTSHSFNELAPDDIIIAPSDELIRRAYLVRNRVQCPRCSKIFGGKTPAVAYNNHRRNKHCPATQATVPFLKAKFNNKNKEQSSPQAADTVPPTNSNNPSNPLESESKLPDSLAQVRYYCKLCPNRDIKNRVSLGVHLTTYHGLPPVNISSNEGIALRCQTCSQTFNSKYFYNMHRYECDSTSPYIGILEADKTNVESEDIAPDTKPETIENEEETAAHLPAPPPSIMPPPIQSISPTPASPPPPKPCSNSSPSSVGSAPSSISTPSQSQLPKVQPTFNNPPRGSAVSNAYFGSNYTCTLCHKKGFPGPNAVRIHQKYQCIKRPLVPPPKSPYPSPLAKPRTKSYSRPMVKEESQSEAGSNESRLAALLGSPNPVALNSQLKGELIAEMNRVHESGLLMCEDCGRGPYNSQYYLLEHKRQFCQAGKSNRNNVSSPSNSSSSKSIDIESALEQIPKPISPKTNEISNKTVPPPNNLTQSVPQKAVNSNETCHENMEINSSYNDENNSTKNTSNNTFINTDNHTNNNANKEPNDSVDFDMPENVPPGDSDEIIQCSECGFREADIFKFVRHRLKHLTEKQEDSLISYSCEICKGKATLNQLSRIRQHLHHHLKIYNALYKKYNHKNRKKRSYPFADESDNDDLITCPYCRACQFENAIGLAHHIRTSCPFRFRCVKCDQTFLSKSSLKNHKDTCLEEPNMPASKLLTSCRHCGLKFTSKQRHFYHEQACHKVYNADISQRVVELIERASTCSICGLKAKNYIGKTKHEAKCLEMALDLLGIKCLQFDNIEDNDTESSIFNGESIDESSLISTEEEEEVEEEVEVEDEKLPEETSEESLRKKFGISKEVAVELSKVDDNVLDSHMDYCEKSNDRTNSNSYNKSNNKLESLKQLFEKLLRHLVQEDDVYAEILDGKPVDVALNQILRLMNSEPEANNEMNYIKNFQANIETFLKLSIEKETLEKAYQKTKSIDEVINNLLNIHPPVD